MVGFADGAPVGLRRGVRGFCPCHDLNIDTNAAGRTVKRKDGNHRDWMRSLPYILIGRVTAKGGPPAGRIVAPGGSGQLDTVRTLAMGTFPVFGFGKPLGPVGGVVQGYRLPALGRLASPLQASADLPKGGPREAR